MLAWRPSSCAILSIFSVLAAKSHGRYNTRRWAAQEIQYLREDEVDFDEGEDDMEDFGEEFSDEEAGGSQEAGTSGGDSRLPRQALHRIPIDALRPHGYLAR